MRSWQRRAYPWRPESRFVYAGVSNGALAVNNPSGQADRIALTLLKAEILYLDCRHQESLGLIDPTSLSW